MTWWQYGPLRMIEICETLNLGGVSLEDQAQLVKRLLGNVQHFHCMDHRAHGDDSGGMNDERFYFTTELARVHHPDRLAAYLPLAHANDIRVVVYVNVHWISQEFGARHPEWRQLKEDGTPIAEVYSTATAFCYNTPYRDWVFQMLRDLCRYDIDGIFYDGPVFFTNTCYCEICQRLFRERTGQTMPTKTRQPNHSDPLWRELIAFQTASLKQFLMNSAAVIKAVNPRIAFYDNGNGTSPYWPRGHNNREMIQVMDLLAAEGGYMYGDLNQVAYLHGAGAAAKLFSHQAAGKPAGVFVTTEHGPWTFSMNQRSEISHVLAQTLANGAHYFISAIFPENIQAPSLDVFADYGRLVTDHPDAFHGTTSSAGVALLWPALSVESYPTSSVPVSDFTQEIKADGVGDIYREFYGLYHALAFSQTPFDVIDEQNLAELSRYQLLVLPNAGCLSAFSATQIREFVREGGHLLATFETSLYDETGVRLDDLQLGDLFGVQCSGGTFGPMRWDYVSPVMPVSSPLLEGIIEEFIPSPTYGTRVTLRESQALLFFRERMKGRIDTVPALSPHPCLVHNRFGKGSVVYCAATLGETIHNFRFPEYLTLIRNIVEQMSASLVKIDGAPWVEVSMRRKGDISYLHLINQTTGPRRPMTGVQPLCNVPIHFPKLAITEAHALRGNYALDIRQTAGGGTTVVLNRLDDYEVIALQHSLTSMNQT